ncbi:DUF3829 domain-containing protein [Chitinophaga qingshengii]|uniref:DUF3829 domain-containing protein n=1 Tax=Chitinophaga qingshengii TaxID=1569794 RepID=A0ABR7TQR3_9BACT|nr:DUF3829 domain-containing protein [Chitinophaga qingshengii]MBC9932328.1 DUF3829 domain-containing protein [Chitinophaga qingshengii]
MNKNFLYTAIGVAMLAVSVSSCDNSKGGKGPAAYESNSVEKASHVIEYTNLLIDIANKQNSYITRVAENADKIEKGLKNPSDRFAFIGVFPPSYFESPRAFNKVKPDEPVDELSSDDKKFFKEKWASYSASFKKVQDQYKQLSDYLKAEDYKDDKSAKGLALVDSIRSTTQQLMAEKVVLMKKVNEIADASEVIVLKESPLKDYIIAMKGDLKAVRDFVELVESSEGDYNAIKPKAEAAYAALEKAKEEHSQLNMDNAKKERKDGYYKSFYDRVGDFLIEAKKIMRDSAEKGKINENQAETLGRSYDSLISAYNSFNS